MPKVLLIELQNNENLRSKLGKKRLWIRQATEFNQMQLG
jgi:hypothetical protein